MPFTPGGSNDVVAREIAHGLQTRLKQTAVVENRPGGGGTIAYQFVAKSPPDGHTLMIAPASFTMGPHLSKKQLYHPVKEFAAINLVADVPFVMVVPSSLPVKSVQEFIALAKKSPNKLTFGSVGQGTPQHLGGELFKMSAGVDLIHVPFRGATVVLPDLIAGRIDMFIGAVNSLLELIKDGKLRRARHHEQQAHRVVAGRPDHGGGRAARRARSAPASGWWRRPARRPRSSRRSTARSRRSSPTRASTSAWRRSASTWSAPRAADYAKFLADDYAKWGKVTKAAGIEPQ